MIKLSLPAPSNELINAVVEHSKTAVCNHDDLNIFKTENPDINVAACAYFVTQKITELAEKEYGTFFPNHKIDIVCGVCVQNLNPSNISSLPPHADKIRCTALNYIIDPGGRDVRTVMYDYSGSYDNTNGFVLSYNNNLHSTNSQSLSESNWYGLDVNKIHSVEHIEYDRIMLSLSFVNLTLDELQKEYSHLVTEVL